MFRLGLENIRRRADISSDPAIVKAAHAERRALLNVPQVWPDLSAVGATQQHLLPTGQHYRSEETTAAMRALNRFFGKQEPPQHFAEQERRRAAANTLPYDVEDLEEPGSQVAAPIEGLSAKDLADRFAHGNRSLEPHEPVEEENEVIRRFNALFEIAGAMRSGHPNQPNFTDAEEDELEKRLKGILNSIYNKRAKANEAPKIVERFKPGDFVWGPSAQPLLDSNLSPADKSVISTPNGPLVNKVRPHVITTQLDDDLYLTVPGGTCGGKEIDADSSRFSRAHVKELVRLKHKAARPSKLEGVREAILMETDESLESASNLNVTSLGMLRHRDITKATGNQVAKQSVPELIKLLLDRTVEHLQPFARAYGLVLKVTRDVTELRPPANDPSSAALPSQAQAFRDRHSWKGDAQRPDEYNRTAKRKRHESYGSQSSTSSRSRDKQTGGKKSNSEDPWSRAKSRLLSKARNTVGSKSSGLTGDAKRLALNTSGSQTGAAQTDNRN